MTTLSRRRKLIFALVTFVLVAGTMVIVLLAADLYVHHRTQNVAEATAQKIDAEVKRLVDEGYQKAKQILTEKAEDHNRLAEALLEYESLSGEEIAAVLRGEKLNRPEDIIAPPSPPTPSCPYPKPLRAACPAVRRKGP